MDERTVYFLSDQTGVTAETLGHSLLTQFDARKFRQVTLPFIDLPKTRHEEAVRRINEAAAKSSLRPDHFFDPRSRKNAARSFVKREGLRLDIFDAFLELLGAELNDKPCTFRDVRTA